MLMKKLLIGLVVDYEQDHGKSDKYAYSFALGIARWWLMFSFISFFEQPCLPIEIENNSS